MASRTKHKPDFTWILLAGIWAVGCSPRHLDALGSQAPSQDGSADADFSSPPAFFAQGFYIDEKQSIPEMLRQLRVIGQAGFTVAHLEANEPSPQLFEEANRLDMHLIFAPIKTAVCTESPAALHAVIDRAKTLPALFAYNIANDLYDGPLVGCPRNVNDVSAMYDDYKTYDPTHAYFVAVGNGAVETVFSQKRFDIAAVQTYPINGGSPIRLVYEAVVGTATLAARRWNQSTWVILQTFNWGGAQQRYPTAQEYTNMMYQALAAGARGTINSQFQDIESQPQLFDAIKALVPELKRLSHFLVNGTFTRTVLGQGLYGATWEDGEEALAIVVNAGNYASYLDPKMNLAVTDQVSLLLPAGFVGPAVAPFANRPMVMNVSAGRLVGSLDLLDVSVNIVRKR